MKDYKVIFIPSVGTMGEYVKYYDTLDEAVSVLTAIADYTLILHETSLMPDYSNMGMIFKNILGEWEEIDDDGNYI